MYKKIAALLLCIACAGYLVLQAYQGRFAGLSQAARLDLSDYSQQFCSQAELVSPPAIIMQEASALLGPPVPTKTFALAVSDLDGDARDDIIVGAHEKKPLLYLNREHHFSDESGQLYTSQGNTDLHGYTLADLDNDGDLDLAIAGGGADGVGKGQENIFLENLSAPGRVAFRRKAVASGMELAGGRSRSLLPLASADGRAIDLYFTSLPKEGFANRLLRNRRNEGEFEFVDDDTGFFPLSVKDRGRGVIADFDGDGRRDYLIVTDNLANIFWHPEAGKARTALANRVYTALSADFNNDGKLDIFLGRYSPPSDSDFLSLATGGLIFVINRKPGLDYSALSLRSNTGTLTVDLSQHQRLDQPGKAPGVSDIYLGRDGKHPSSRQFVIDSTQASGRPTAMSQPGTYLWYSPQTERWHIHWRFSPAFRVFQGSIRGDHIDVQGEENIRVHQGESISDALLINRGDGTFSRLCTPDLAHKQVTAAVTAADFNNDGWLDIMTLRRGGQGVPNGSIQVLNNHQGKAFVRSEIPPREQDRLAAADLIAHGFFDNDNKADIVSTHGYGQVPGTHGAPRLMLNTSDTTNEALLLRIVGVNANRYGIGARLTLNDASGQIIGYRVQGLNANVSQDTHLAHFGLGSSSPPYLLTVEWPDSSTSRHTFETAGKYTVRQK